MCIFMYGIIYGAEVKEIKIKKINENIKVLVSTDASEYKDFVIQDSERIVIDFLNSYSYLPLSIPSSYLPLVRIRTSQYKVAPPITRVVLDLKHKTPYTISRTSKGIEINLGKAEEIVKPVELVLESTMVKKDTVKIEKDTIKATVPLLPVPFFYNPRGKRDPFKPYIGTPSKDTLLDVSTAVIVGIMWSPDERYALAEDASSKAFILREGDPVSNGKVLTIEKKEVTFLMRVFGGTKKVTLKIIPRKEKE